VREAWRSTVDIVRRVWPFVVAGIGVGALIHGFVPTDLVVSVGGRDNPLAVPALVLLGVPLYSNAAGTIPIVEALLGKGLPLGSALAFMMAVTALSIPELVILRRVMKPRLIATFVAVVTAGILAVGYGFNLFLA
jgi:Predicted permeases